MFISSSDSTNLHAGNIFSDFVFELPSFHSFGDGEGWSFALTDLHIEKTKPLSGRHDIPESIVVCCDLARESYIRSRLLPVLRYVPATTDEISGASLFMPYYVGISKTRVQRIRIFLLDSDLNPLNKKQAKLWPGNLNLTCTLHFQRM